MLTDTIAYIVHTLYLYINRRCGYIFERWRTSNDIDYRYYYGTTEGGSDSYFNTMNGKSYCPRMSQVFSDYYDAICASQTTGTRWYSNPCPKGWGKNKGRYPNDYYSVGNAQGFYRDGGDPIYSTVTKYRDAVYNYITTRVAKA